ncbi:MAG TPA: hypothetical protein VFS16_17625 [Acidimicrobiia bacterium]|nr:hypothetical protein [Acidimicrobiia bacterium]
MAFDVVLADLPLVGRSTAVLVTPSGRLEVAPATRAVAARGYIPLRQARGSLRLRLRPSIDVTVDVLPWSARCSEIMLSSDSSSGTRHLLTTRRFLRAADDMVAALSQAIEQWPLGFLGGLADPLDDLTEAHI